MEEYKKRYLKDFLQLSQTSLKECYELVQINETKLRNCYADPIELNSDDFVKMVLLDAVFLLMTFLCRRINFNNLSLGRKRMFEKPTMMHDIRSDLMLLENQLPFFIIEELYKLSNIHNKQNLSSIDPYEEFKKGERIYLNEETAMVTLAIDFLDNLNLIDMSNRSSPPTESKHLLALLRSCLKPKDWNPERKSAIVLTMPSIEELEPAGVKFKAGSIQNLFDIKFNNGVLEIPVFSIHNFTELLYRNLQAFELCFHIDDLLCLDYLYMMHRFTISSKDVDVLKRNRIMGVGVANSQAVSMLFHSLCQGSVMDTNNFGYSDVIIGLNAHYAVPWNRWKATWIRKYFKAPWAIFSFTSVVILLILTIVQTVCSILQII